eukprot:jgi/Botrbrau1/16037/Bobra.7_2s0011.1
MQNARPEIPKYPHELQGGSFEGLPTYIALMQHCWAQEPAHRPDLVNVISTLEHLLSTTTVPGAARKPPPRVPTRNMSPQPLQVQSTSTAGNGSEIATAPAPKMPTEVVRAHIVRLRKASHKAQDKSRGS